MYSHVLVSYMDMSLV